MASLEHKLWHKIRALSDRLDTDAFRRRLNRMLGGSPILATKAVDMNNCITQSLAMELKKARRK